MSNELVATLPHHFCKCICDLISHVIFLYLSAVAASNGKRLVFPTRSPPEQRSQFIGNPWKPHVNGPKLGFLQDSPETNPMQYKSLRIIIPGIQRGNPSLSQSIESQKLGIWHFSHAAQTPTRRQKPQALQNHKHWRPKRNQTNLILDQLWNPHLHLNDSSEISKNEAPRHDPASCHKLDPRFLMALVCFFLPTHAGSVLLNQLLVHLLTILATTRVEWPCEPRKTLGAAGCWKMLPGLIYIGMFMGYDVKCG